MEETIPLMMSDALLKAPEEVRKPKRHEREQEELTHDERKAKRRLKKASRKHALHEKVEKGQLSVEGLREREAKLKEKNSAAKKERASLGEVKDARSKLRNSELLAQAA